MLVRPLTQQDQIQRQNLLAKIKTLQQAGICPTGQNLETGDVYPPIAEKVYLCTMCDGKRNHLHFQLIPRLAEVMITGSQLFVKERGVLINYNEVVNNLKIEMIGSINEE